MSYYQVTEGEWIQPRRRAYKMACCDCSLVHVLNFRIVKGAVQLQAFRDKRATATMRRARGVTIKTILWKVPSVWRVDE